MTRLRPDDGSGTGDSNERQPGDVQLTLASLLDPHKGSGSDTGSVTSTSTRIDDDVSEDEQGPILNASGLKAMQMRTALEIAEGEFFRLLPQSVKAELNDPNLALSKDFAEFFDSKSFRDEIALLIGVIQSKCGNAGFEVSKETVIEIARYELCLWGVTRLFLNANRKNISLSANQKNHLSSWLHSIEAQCLRPFFLVTTSRRVSLARQCVEPDKAASYTSNMETREILLAQFLRNTYGGSCNDNLDDALSVSSFELNSFGDAEALGLQEQSAHHGVRTHFLTLVSYDPAIRAVEAVKNLIFLLDQHDWELEKDPLAYIYKALFWGDHSGLLDVEAIDYEVWLQTFFETFVAELHACTGMLNEFRDDQHFGIVGLGHPYAHHFLTGNVLDLEKIAIMEEMADAFLEVIESYEGENYVSGANPSEYDYNGFFMEELSSPWRKIGPAKNRKTEKDYLKNLRMGEDYFVNRPRSIAEKVAVYGGGALVAVAVGTVVTVVTLATAGIATIPLVTVLAIGAGASVSGASFAGAGMKRSWRFKVKRRWRKFKRLFRRRSTEDEGACVGVPMTADLNGNNGSYGSHDGPPSDSEFSSGDFDDLFTFGSRLREGASRRGFDEGGNTAGSSWTSTSDSGSASRSPGGAVLDSASHFDSNGSNIVRIPSVATVATPGGTSVPQGDDFSSGDDGVSTTAVRRLDFDDGAGIGNVGSDAASELGSSVGPRLDTDGERRHSLPALGALGLAVTGAAKAVGDAAREISGDDDVEYFNYIDPDSKFRTV